MIYVENDTLIIRLTDVHPNAGVAIDLQRTLRLPDDGVEHHLPPGFGSFPLRHIEDYDLGTNNALTDRGGLIMPMFQADALWLNFNPYEGDHDLPEYPMAIRIAAGKVCALTGDVWAEGLKEAPQNYAVIPDQPWLDGFNVGKGVVRQFVAAPLGDGVTVEEQLKGTTDVGGIQIQVFPMKREVFEKLGSQGFGRLPEVLYCKMESSFMGLGAGGKMQQDIYDDEHGLDAWDQTVSEKCFITIANANQWMSITKEAPPLSPVTAEQYASAGLPWFSYYDGDKVAIEGASKLGKVKSFQEAYADKGQSQWSEEAIKHQPNVVPIGARSVTSGDW